MGVTAMSRGIRAVERGGEGVLDGPLDLILHDAHGEPGPGHGHSASYRRTSRLLADLAIARADGTYPKLLASLAKTEVLVLDDFGLAKLSAENRRDLLEIIEDRHAVRSTIVTSQLPVEKWHAMVGDPTLADAILDRLVHSAYQLNLKGESMRKRHRPLTQTDHHGT